ncbi:MAG TPA: GDP-L-fucose synthase [Bacteroidales bacterium]|nr:GDP-L-fucose synthase [Bacteroidales bacterium]HRZ48696.1 GDP-L-fucose synthase [Bacteroidales bacterium]
MNQEHKIYIAGHLGMVGSAIHRNLKAKGYTNFVLRTLEELDLTCQDAVNRFFATEKPEYVFIAAAKVGGIIANNTFRAQFIYENLMIQNNIIHAAYNNGVQKLLFLGSSCIYPKDAPQPLKEEYLLTGLLEPTNEPYAIAKIAGIKMAESYHRQYGCDYISVMPTNLYGPNDNYDLDKSHVLPALIRKFHLGRCLETGNWDGIRKDFATRPIAFKGQRLDEASAYNLPQEDILKVLAHYGIRPQAKEHSKVSITLWGTGNVFREFLHVEDMADACVFLMEHLPAEKLYGTLKQTHVNIGTGIDLTIRDLACKVKELTGFSGEVKWDTEKPDGMLKKQLDVSLLKSLGWQPVLGLDEGLRQVYKGFSK